MTKLLLLIIIVIAIVVLIYSFLKRIIRRFINPFHNNENIYQNVNDKGKSRIIYERDDVVVMKGDASEKTDKKL